MKFEKNRVDNIAARYGLNDNSGVGHPILEDELQDDINYLVEKINSKDGLINEIKKVLGKSYPDVSSLRAALVEVFPVHELIGVKNSIDDLSKGGFIYAFSRLLLLNNPDVLDGYRGESILISEDFLKEIEKEKCKSTESGKSNKNLNVKLGDIHRGLKMLKMAPYKESMLSKYDPDVIEVVRSEFPVGDRKDILAYMEYNESSVDKPVVFVTEDIALNDSVAKAVNMSLLVLQD